MRWGAILVAVAVLLAGCDSGTARNGAARSKEWSLHVIGGQITLKRSTGNLALNVLSGRPSDLAMSCRSDGRFLVRLETRPETAGKTVELSAGRGAVTLSRGDGFIDETALALLSSGQPISAKVGDTALGPFNPPFDHVTDELVDQCRKWMKAAPPAADWSLTITGGGLAIVHASGGKEDLRIYCTADGNLGAQAPTLKVIASEERFSLGTGSDAHVLVADPASGAVVAAGPMDDALITALAGGQPISASYGAQNLGPFTAPPEEMRNTFAANCRQRAFEAAAKG
ncbi:MAG: hypothetical protein JWR84_171 [Caulobacter sp.]|nr:hypothetical protein [Caulobacter sp.]